MTIEQFQSLGTDHLLDIRPGYRRNKLFSDADAIRDILDSRNIFVFDLPGDFQEVWNLNDPWFRNKPEAMSKRQYVEHRMKQDSKAERIFDAWLFSMKAA